MSKIYFLPLKKAMENIKFQQFQQFTCEVFTRQTKQTLDPQFKLFNIDRCDTILYKLSKQLNVQYYDIFCAIIQENTIHYFYSFFKNGNLLQQIRPCFIYNSQQQNCISIGGINILKEFKEDLYKMNTTYDFIPNTKYLGEIIIDKPFSIELALLDYTVKESLDEVGQILKTGYLQINFPYKFLSSGSQQKAGKQYNEEQIVLKQISSEIFQDPIQKQTIVEFIDFYTDIPSSGINIEQIFNALPLVKLGLDFAQLYYLNLEHMFTALKSTKQMLEFKIIRKSKFKEQLILFGKQFRIIIYPDATVLIRIFLHQSIKNDYNTLISTNQSIYQEIFEKLNIYIQKTIGKKISIDQDKLKVSVKLLSQYTFDFNIQQLFQNFQKTIKSQNSSIFQYDNAYFILTTRFFFGMEPCKLSVVAYKNTIYFKYQTFFSAFNSLFPDLFCKYLQFLEKESENTKDGRELALTKRLLLNDPVLFSNLIQENFSRVCQKGKQPELANKSQAGEQFVSKYWNFTTNTEQYYKCNQENPYLIFRLGHHVDGFCLPCCGNRNPKNSAPTLAIQQKCQRKIAVLKDVKDAKYILKNINKFSVGRFTILHKSFYQTLDSRMCVKCLMIPDNDAPSIQKIKSLLNTVSYLLGINPQEFQNLIVSFVNKNPTFSRFSQELKYLISGNMFTKYNDNNWIIFLTFYINQVHQLDLLIFSILNEEPSASFSQLNNKNAIYIYKSNGVYNPIVSVKDIEEGVIQKVPVFMQTANFTTNLNNYQLLLQLQKQNSKFKILSQVINKRNMCNYILCTLNGKFIIAPVIEQIPEQLPVLEEIQQEVFQNLINIHDLLIFLNNYQGNIQHIIKVKNQFVSIVKSGLFFDFEAINELPQELSNVGIVEYGLTPAQMNNLVLKIQNENPKLIHNKLLGIYQTYIYQLIQLCDKFNSSSANLDTKDQESYIHLKLEQFQTKISQYISANQTNLIPKILLPCNKQPSQFFCQDGKLIIIEELLYLKNLVDQQLEKQSINLENFKQGLFILIGRLQFVVGKDEFLIIKEVKK